MAMLLEQTNASYFLPNLAVSLCRQQYSSNNQLGSRVNRPSSKCSYLEQHTFQALCFLVMCSLSALVTGCWERSFIAALPQHLTDSLGTFSTSCLHKQLQQLPISGSRSLLPLPPPQRFLPNNNSQVHSYSSSYISNFTFVELAL